MGTKKPGGVDAHWSPGKAAYRYFSLAHDIRRMLARNYRLGARAPRQRVGQVTRPANSHMNYEIASAFLGSYKLSEIRILTGCGISIRVYQGPIIRYV